VWDAVMGQQVDEALVNDNKIRERDVATAPAVQANTHLQRDGGWLNCSKKETQSFILWIPHSLRRRDFIWYPCNMVISRRPKIVVRFEEAAWGPDWTKIKR